jgi:hypothetical protein
VVVLREILRSKALSLTQPTCAWAWAEACARIGVGKFDKEQRKYEGLKIRDLRRRFPKTRGAENNAIFDVKVGGSSIAGFV